MQPVISSGEPLESTKIEEIVEQFHRDGYYHLGGVLSAEEVAALKDAMDRAYADPSLDGEDFDHKRGNILIRMFEKDRAFRDLNVREPFIGLGEAILGPDCHIISQNAMRTGKGEGVSGWHVDFPPVFPLPDEVPRHDPRLRVPCFVMNILIPLTDVESDAHGPTQVVPGSHYSGRHPNDPEYPTFEGRGPISLFAKAGDAYMFHNQVWHRGAINTSDRPRYMAGVVYGQRLVAQRFYPFLNYQMPEHVLQDADERLLRVLGKHAKGPYG